MNDRSLIKYVAQQQNNWAALSLVHMTAEPLNDDQWVSIIEDRKPVSIDVATFKAASEELLTQHAKEAPGINYLHASPVRRETRQDFLNLSEALFPHAPASHGMSAGLWDHAKVPFIHCDPEYLHRSDTPTLYRHILLSRNGSCPIEYADPDTCSDWVWSVVEDAAEYILRADAYEKEKIKDPIEASALLDMKDILNMRSQNMKLGGILKTLPLGKVNLKSTRSPSLETGHVERLGSPHRSSIPTEPSYSVAHRCACNPYGVFL